MEMLQSRAENLGINVDIKIYEGTFISTRYTVDSSDADQRFVLTSNSADTTTLTVKVQNSSSDTTVTTYTEATDITQVGTDSNVYFMQEVERGLFEVYFGDGVVGTALSDDNIVILTYVVSNRGDANGAAIFTNSGAIAGITDVSVTTDATATGGADPETLKSIKYNGKSKKYFSIKLATIILTIITGLVAFVSNKNTSFESTSTNTGVAPVISTAFAVAIKVRSGIITSSPLFRVAIKAL